MANPCIKTGADVWLTCYGGYLHGDLFKIGDCYVLHYTQAGVQYDMTEEECHGFFFGAQGLVLDSARVWIEQNENVGISDPFIKEQV